MMIQGMEEGRNVYNNGMCGLCWLWRQWKAGSTDVSLTVLAMLKVSNLSLSLSLSLVTPEATLSQCLWHNTALAKVQSLTVVRHHRHYTTCIPHNSKLVTCCHMQCTMYFRFKACKKQGSTEKHFA